MKKVRMAMNSIYVYIWTVFNWKWTYDVNILLVMIICLYFMWKAEMKWMQQCCWIYWNDIRSKRFQSLCLNYILCWVICLHLFQIMFIPSYWLHFFICRCVGVYEKILWYKNVYSAMFIMKSEHIRLLSHWFFL